MGNEFKWYAIMCIGLFASMFGMFSLEAKYDSECKVAALSKNLPLEEVRKLCE